MTPNELKLLLLDQAKEMEFKPIFLRYEMRNIFRSYLDDHAVPFVFGNAEYPAGSTLEKIDPQWFDHEFFVWLNAPEGDYREVIEGSLWVSKERWEDFLYILTPYLRNVLNLLMDQVLNTSPQ